MFSQWKSNFIYFQNVYSNTNLNIKNNSRIQIGWNQFENVEILNLNSSKSVSLYSL